MAYIKACVVSAAILSVPSNTVEICGPCASICQSRIAARDEIQCSPILKALCKGLHPRVSGLAEYASMQVIRRAALLPGALYLDKLRTTNLLEREAVEKLQLRDA